MAQTQVAEQHDGGGDEIEPARALLLLEPAVADLAEALKKTARARAFQASPLCG